MFVGVLPASFEVCISRYYLNFRRLWMKCTSYSDMIINWDAIKSYL